MVIRDDKDGKFYQLLPEKENTEFTRRSGPSFNFDSVILFIILIIVMLIIFL